jgi:hypothetical protein
MICFVDKQHAMTLHGYITARRQCLRKRLFQLRVFIYVWDSQPFLLNGTLDHFKNFHSTLK